MTCPHCGQPANIPRIRRPFIHLITATLDLACGHDGKDPSSSVLAEVTCPACEAHARSFPSLVGVDR